MADFIPPPSPGARHSPFRPGFGTTPPALVGRQSYINHFARSLDGPSGSPGRAAFVTGQRGMGKTVLLNVFEAIADSRQWLRVREQASAGFAQRLAHARIPEVLEAHDAHNTTTSKTVGFTLPFTGGGLTTRTESTSALVPDFRSHLMRTLDLLAEHDTGLLIALDEVHRTNLDELRGITDAVAYAFSQEAPLAIVVAGLPSSIDDIVNDDVSTFLRRADRISLGNLTDEQVATALAEPIRDGGKGIMSEALDLAVSVTQGYPYLVQVVGHLSWVAAADESTITVDHVQSVVEEATETLNQQIHAPTLAALSERQRDYLTAMSSTTGPSMTRDVAEALSISKQAGNGLREQLMSLGIIESPGKGLVDFSIPYLRDYIHGTMNAGGLESSPVDDSPSFSPDPGRAQVHNRSSDSPEVDDAQALGSIGQALKGRPPGGPRAGLMRPGQGAFSTGEKSAGTASTQSSYSRDASDWGREKSTGRETW